MSGEVGVLVFAPVVVPLAMIGGASFLMGKMADAAIERERRHREASWRTDRALDRYRALQRRVATAREQFGPEIDPLPDPPGGLSPGGDMARAESIAASLGAAAEAAEQRLRQQLAAVRARRIVATVQRTMNQLLAQHPGQVTRPGETSRWIVELEDSLRRVLSRMDSGVPAPAAGQLEEWAIQAMRSPSPATGRRLLDDLRYHVDKANKSVAARRGRLAELYGRLHGLSGGLIDDALAVLAAAQDHPDPDWAALSDTVTAAADRTRAEALRGYTTQALRESLEEIGLELEADFETLLTEGGIAHVRRDGWEDVAVRVRRHPDGSTMYFNMVTPRAPGGAVEGAEPLDQSTERQWCAAFDNLVPALADRGVEVEVTHRSEPGEAEAQPVDEARFPFERRRRDRRDADRQRERRR
jgi:hypothetical protein